MLEIANILILGLLSAAGVWLVYDRRRLRRSIEDYNREDLVDRTELDSYHHRVVQLYQTQRDWCRGKFEESDHRLGALEDKSRVDRVELAPSSNPRGEPSQRKEGIPEEDPSATEGTVELERISLQPTGKAIPNPPIETAPETESFSSAEEKVLEAWAAGGSIDEIAQELRMGRQEVQLLIQVSRKRPMGHLGV